MGNKSIRATEKGAHLFYLALTVGYMAGIYWLSSIPGEVNPESPLLSGIIAWTPTTLQNLLHVPLFGMLAWLWYRTLYIRGMHHGSALAATFVLAAGFGVVDEGHQLHVPGRYASLTDIALNCAGVVLALWWIHHQRQRSVHPGTGRHTVG